MTAHSHSLLALTKLQADLL